jgi:hypothetical protein
MSIFRTYFEKNTTLIEGSLSNNSQNPVTEISYGTFDKLVSRYIFDVNLDNLRAKIANGLINPNGIVKHVLHMTNTIAYAPQYIGKKSYTTNINRATSFQLDLFNVSEDWDEGGGYEFNYVDPLYNAINQAANWIERKTGINWTNEGAYLTGSTEILGSQLFSKGNEDIEIDVTDYINQRLSGVTGYSYGLGIKFADIYEDIETEFRQAVAFHGRHTHTFYEPYIETIINDTIIDDRNYFYQNKDNYLYLYSNIGNFPQNILVNKVEIYDNNDNLIDTLSGNSIINVSKGIYKIMLNISSDDYPDAVIFKDVWYITVNGRSVEHEGEFYLISPDKYYSFNQSNIINFDNYFFYFWGIGEKENIRAGVIKKIKLTIKELYANQNNFLPLELEYRLFTTVGKKYQIDVIPFTSVNRTNKGYEFDLDTSWLIPQDYFLQIRMKNGNYYENKQTLSFTVVSDGSKIIC